MTWIIRRDKGILHPNRMNVGAPTYLPHYFTGVGFSRERRHAVRFAYRYWAEGMLRVLQQYWRDAWEARVIKLVRPKRNRRCFDSGLCEFCKDCEGCCPCLRPRKG